MYILSCAENCCLSEESRVGQEWSNSGTPAMLNHRLREAQRKHGFDVDAVMDPKVSELCLLQ